MGPEDEEELSSRIFQVARDSTGEQTLEAGLWEVIDDFSKKFPGIGRATAMHEATSFLFNNDARHLSFFPNLALLTYQELVKTEQWHEASSVSEYMTRYQFDLLLDQQGNERELIKWFKLWTESVKGWCKITVTKQSWADWGTGILDRCEQFSIIPVIENEVYDFWDSLIQIYGTFELTKESLERLRRELIDMERMAVREMDYQQFYKKVLLNKLRLLHKFNLGDLVDVMNRMIESATKGITDEEIEIELYDIYASKDINEACNASNNLASRLRISGQIGKGIEILSSLIERGDFDIQYDIAAISYLKLAIYLDEVGRGDEAEPLFKMVADEDPGTNENSITAKTILEACNRYSSFLCSSSRFSESKNYCIRENALAKLIGDPFLFVRSCFNIAADCVDLRQEGEAIEWFVIGMNNLRDGLGSGPMGMIPKQYQKDLIDQSHALAEKIGQGERWAMMMLQIFPGLGGSPGNS
jgi:tetratricopeptide (TPR) repeat protein